MLDEEKSKGGPSVLDNGLKLIRETGEERRVSVEHNRLGMMCEGDNDSSLTWKTKTQQVQYKVMIIYS